MKIGVPEVIAGAEFSLQNLASNLTSEGLTQLSPDGRVLPKLAENWTWENDGLALRVNLRPGVVFHNGEALTASVAADLLRKAIAEPSNRAVYTSFNDVKDVRPSGESQLVFYLSQRSAFLPEDLVIPVELGKPSVGTGAYRVSKRDDEGISLEGNKRYYLGAPQIDKVQIKPFGALRTAWSGLLRGEVDMVTEVPPDAVEFIRNDEVQVVSFERRYQYVIAFNSQRRPFNIPLVRRAINAAVDRPALIKSVLHGLGTPSTGPLWPQHWAYDSSMPSFGYDPALATSLLESSGFRLQRGAKGLPARFHFTCLIPKNFAMSERMGLEVQKQLYDIGVDMQFEVVPAEELDSRLRSGRFDALLLDMLGGPTVGRAYMFWASARNLKGLNLFGYDNPQVERLFGVLRTTTNEAAVRSATRDLQRILLDDPPALFLAWSQRSRAVRRAFQVVQDSGRDPVDPVFTIWRWGANSSRQALAQ
ncbi:MAG TPA: ABC transporter substrate-binding protein [Vicinamibacterales bacterium]|nr:ABC transporter substrate-binding protein [Vicinamibacterales bacterium]